MLTKGYKGNLRGDSEETSGVMLLWAFVSKFLCEHTFISLGYIPGSRIAGGFFCVLIGV